LERFPDNPDYGIFLFCHDKIIPGLIDSVKVYVFMKYLTVAIAAAMQFSGIRNAITNILLCKPMAIHGFFNFRSYPYLKKNYSHPTLEFSKKGAVWTVNIGYHYRDWIGHIPSD